MLVLLPFDDLQLWGHSGEYLDSNDIWVVRRLHSSHPAGRFALPECESPKGVALRALTVVDVPVR